MLVCSVMSAITESSRTFISVNPLNNTRGVGLEPMGPFSGSD